MRRERPAICAFGALSVAAVVIACSSAADHPPLAGGLADASDATVNDSLPSSDGSSPEDASSSIEDAGPEASLPAESDCVSFEYDDAGTHHFHWSFCNQSDCETWMSDPGATTFNGQLGADQHLGYCNLCTPPVPLVGEVPSISNGYEGLAPGKYMLTAYIKNGTPSATNASLAVQRYNPTLPDLVTDVPLTAGWTKNVIAFDVPAVGHGFVLEVRKDDIASTCIGVDELDLLRISD